MASENSYAQLIDDYENGIQVIEGETFDEYQKRMGGIDYNANGGLTGMGYANGGGIGTMMQPKKKFTMQGNKKPARNYLGEQKTVTNVPLKWQSGPDAPPTELAYITQKEKNLLLKKDLHGSLKNGPNTGPDGIMSLDSQGDYTRDRSSNNQANANSGSNRADRENARQVENRMKDILTGNISTGQTSAVSNRTRRGAVPEFVDTVDKQGNVTGTNYVGSAYKSYGQPGFFGNLFGGSNPGYRSAYGTGSGIFGNFGGRFNKDANNITYNPETERYESTNQSVGEVKPGMGGRILGGLVSLLTGVPLVGSLIGNQIDKFKPKTYMEKQTPEELSRMRGLQMIDGQLVDTRMLDFDPNAQTQRPTSVPMDSLSLNNFNKQPEYDAYLESQGYI